MRRRLPWRDELTEEQREHLAELKIRSAADLRDMWEKMSAPTYTLPGGRWACDVCCDISEQLRSARPDLGMPDKWGDK